MQINIRTSEANKQVVQELTRRMRLNHENVISRIALSYSLNSQMKLDLVRDLKDSKGKEYKEDILLGKYKEFYIALICQHYQINKTNKDIPKYMKMHIDHGLELVNKLFENNKNYTGLDFLIDNVERGITSLEEAETAFGMVKNSSQNIVKGSYSGAISVKVGQNKNGEDIVLNLNDTGIHNNQHIAVAGNSGTGKTQFALSLLKQIADGANGSINFIYLDFKGLKKEDEKNLKPFFNSTKANYINAPEISFPLHPLSFIDNVNAKSRAMGINKFVDIVTKYTNLGKVQEQTLKDATRMAFDEMKSGSYPTFEDIYDQVRNLDGGKRSRLHEFLSSMAELQPFSYEVNPESSFLNRNYYLSLSGDMPDYIRFTSTFLIINYIYNVFMNMENAPVENNVQSMRYVLLIDEAHTIFREKKSQEILEKMLREIRSKGVSVILVSQGIAEFNQPSFDFSSMCETAYLLDIKDKTNMKSMLKFLGLGEKEIQPLARSMEQIAKGQAVTNMKEFKKIELFKISQFYELK
jgi:DNA sulfur modification protein DndE